VYQISGRMGDALLHKCNYFRTRSHMRQDEALEVLKTKGNVYLTGRAGSGKTYVLQRYIDWLRFKGIHVGVTASTGVAATHLSGMTIHSWAGIGIKGPLTEKQIEDLKKRNYLRKRLMRVEVLIIDEVSMLSSSVFENIDKVLRAFKEKDEPFGGVQIILCGDFFQLPPIQKSDTRQSTDKESDSRVEFIYKSTLWQELDLRICYLDRSYRQVDDKFLRLLNEIRSNMITKDTWETLRECFLAKGTGKVVPTKLYTHNEHADDLNAQEIAKIKGPSKQYSMKAKGNENFIHILKKSCLAPEQLILKRGALVMFVKNNLGEGYVNGTMGKVIDFTEYERYPVVETFDGAKIKATPQLWEIEEDGDVMASITQIPLRLAWAITIHKSQGMTLDAAEIDLGKSFVTGLGYVALTRVRSLDGIKLKSINRTALTVNTEVIEVDKKLQEMSEELATELRNSPWMTKSRK
jgi:ATP-dependent exoDNAse (exonuclease V) alpha subunit